jgi:hypothetical protein
MSDTFAVNSFAKVYFFLKRPFHLPLRERLISLPSRDGNGMNPRESFSFILRLDGVGNNFP